MMTLYDIKKLNGLIAVLEEASAAWRASFKLQVLAELVLQEVDTSINSAYEADRPGTVSQITVPKLYVDYWMMQEDGALIELPIPASHCFPALASSIEFHTEAIRRLLVDYAPMEADWAEAEAAATRYQNSGALSNWDEAAF